MQPSISLSQITGWGLLLAWLGLCVACDLRSRQVPARLTVPPLILSAAWQLVQGGGQVVLLVVALVLISDLPSRWRIPLGGLAAALALSVSSSAELVYAQLAVFAVWALWEVGATGGADAKIIITLVLLFGNGLVFILIVFVGGFQGLLGLVTRQRTISYTVSILLGTAAWLLMKVCR